MRKEINSKYNRRFYYVGNYFLSIIALNVENGEVKAICVCIERKIDKASLDNDTFFVSVALFI